MTYTLGLDLGTTASAAGINDDGNVSMFTVGHRDLVIPSVVYLGPDGTMVVGEAAERRATEDPNGVAREFKRRFGDPQPLILSGSPVAANDLMIELARHLVSLVAEQRGSRPDEIVVCHPANWGDYKVSLLGDSLASSGLPPHSLLSEPLAAAIHDAAEQRAGGVDVDPGSIVAVYDLGGGTFDVALLRKLDIGWELVGRPGGIERLGGIDFDTAVLHHVVSALGIDLTEFDDTDLAAQTAMLRLRHECRSAKHALSEDTTTTVPVLLPGISETVRITRSEFEALIDPAIDRTLEVFEATISTSPVTLDEIDRVLLVGGSSQIPLVAQRVQSRTNRPVATDRHPKHAVALGAAASTSVSGEGAALPPAAPPPTEELPPPDEPVPVSPPPPPVGDMYKLPHISEAPLPDFMARRSAPVGDTSAVVGASPDPVTTGPRSDEVATGNVPGPPPSPVARPPTRSTEPPSTTVLPPADPVTVPDDPEPTRTKGGWWLAIAAVLAVAAIGTFFAIRAVDDDSAAPSTSAVSTTEVETTTTTAPTTTLPPTTASPLGDACTPDQAPDPAVTYRVTLIPDTFSEPTLNGRNVPATRTVNGIESEVITEFLELSELDLTYEHCLTDFRGRPWWGVNFEDQVVWSSTLFIEPVP